MTDDNQTPLSSPLDDLDSLTSATEAAAQDLVSQAAAEMDKVEVEEKVEEVARAEEAPEVKAPEVSVLPKLSVGVEEHPISDEDAAKFVGSAGDFAMPVSPLDDLSSLTPKADTASEAEPMPVPRVETPSVVLPKLEEKKTDVIRPLETKDLEQKAKDMLSDLGPVQSPPKKGSPVTKMALAAVLVILMGAGGIVGVNLLKTNQSTEDRSKAYSDCPVGQRDYYGGCLRNDISGCGPGEYAKDGRCVMISGCQKTSWGVSCGPTTDPCAPDLTKGGDYCIKDGKSVKCEEVGLIRCNCGSMWVIGEDGGNCDSLCGHSNAICESCDDGDDDDDDDDPNPTPTPTPTLACTGLTSSVAVGSITIGSPTTFTCAGSTGAAKATFSYTIDGGAAIAIPTSTDNPLKSQAITFTEKGSYKVSCKVCKSDGTTCSE